MNLEEVGAPSRTVLVVEDEEDIATLLEHVLAKDGYRVLVSRDGRQALESIPQIQPDLVILDLMLPEVSGFDVLKILNQRGPAARPKVMILSARTEEIDRVLGFELGADDYVTKPFSPREVVLRARALLRRDARSQQEETVVRSGPIEIDTDNHQVRVDGRPITLTLTEFHLLTDLVRAKGRVRTREALLSEIWGYDSDVMSRTVDTHIRRLRNKLGSAEEWLSTVRGVGYRIRDPRSA
jgi:two-component system phosphate regulon response regulator PhoB